MLALPELEGSLDELPDDPFEAVDPDDPPEPPEELVDDPPLLPDPPEDMELEAHPLLDGGAAPLLEPVPLCCALATCIALSDNPNAAAAAAVLSLCIYASSPNEIGYGLCPQHEMH